MIGSEHQRERISERLQKLNNQPRRRGYLPGCELRATDVTGGPARAAYGPQTLQGNWSEEWSDATFAHRSPMIPTELQKRWRTTYQVMSEEATENSRIKPPAQVTQVDMVDIVDGRGQCFPGHQYVNDPGYRDAIATVHTTTMREAYRNPRYVHEKEKKYVPPVLCRTPDAQPRAVLLSLRHRMMAIPGANFAGLRRSLIAATTTEGHRANDKELQRGFEAYGVATNEAEVACLMSYFDKENKGDVPVTEVCDALRGELPARRLALVKKAYTLIQAQMHDVGGVVRLGDIERLFDAAHHPDVPGRRSEQGALKDFMSQWMDLSREAVIELSDFIDYYRDISALVDNNQFFESMMRNVWHISGGESNCRNVSCRRVLVVHKSGRLTVEEIIDDLGIAPTDIDKMLENLQRQGIKDVERIELEN